MLNDLIPDDPLGFIRRCLKERKIRWTYHVNMRLAGRSISRQTILDSVESLEIIEEYPKDKYLPSFLLFARHHNVVYHLVVALDLQRDNVRIITAYRPHPDEWEDDLKTRRQSS